MGEEAAGRAGAAWAAPSLTNRRLSCVREFRVLGWGLM